MTDAPEEDVRVELICSYCDEPCKLFVVSSRRCLVCHGCGRRYLEDTPEVDLVQP